MAKNKTLRQVVGENASKIRAAKKLSQPKLVAAARKAGGQIDQSTVGRIERCISPATVDILDALAKGLGVQPWQLLIPEGADEKFLAMIKAWTHADAGGRDLLTIAAEGVLKRHEQREQQHRQEEVPPERARAGSR